MTRARRAGVAAAAAVLSVLLADIVVHGLAGALPRPWLMDFGSFVESGRAAAEGRDPYGVYPLTFRVEIPGFSSENPNLNPPAALPLMELLGADPDPWTSFRLWWAVSLACYAATVALLARRYLVGTPWLVPGVLWMLAPAGLWDTLVLGQIYLPLVLAAAGGWLLLERGRPAAAGLLIGLLVAVKPNFLVWPALLLLAGHARPAAWALATAAALSLLPVARYGPEVYAQWLAVLADEGDRARFPTNASLAGFAIRAGLDRIWGLAAGAGLLAALALWAWRRRPDAMTASAFGLVGALLASPIAWVHYALVLTPVLLARRSSPFVLVAAALLLVPVPAAIGALTGGPGAMLGLGSIYGWALIACLAGLVAERARDARPAHGRGRVEGAIPASP